MESCGVGRASNERMRKELVDKVIGLLKAVRAVLRVSNRVAVANAAPTTPKRRWLRQQIVQEIKPCACQGWRCLVVVCVAGMAA